MVEDLNPEERLLYLQAINSKEHAISPGTEKLFLDALAEAIAALGQTGGQYTPPTLVLERVKKRMQYWQTKIDSALIPHEELQDMPVVFEKMVEIYLPKPR